MKSVMAIACALAVGAGCGGQDPPAKTPASTTTESPLEASQAKIDKMYADAAQAPAATLDASGPGDDAVGKAIKDAAKAAVADMQPDGPLARGTLKEHGHLQTDVTFKPGRCYAIVGAGAGLGDLDLHLFMPPGILRAEDTTDDAAPVIGKFPDAICVDTPLTYKLDLYADKGSGDVAAQVYSKAK